MSRAKVAVLMAMSDVDLAVWKTKRNQQSYWQNFSHVNWVEFCEKMGKWFREDAPDEWDKYTVWNKERKAKNDEAALLRIVKERAKSKR